MKCNKTFKEKLHNEHGFTLIELIITISIVAVAAGITGFGVSAIFGANMDGMSQDILTEFRNLRFRTTSEINTDYMLEFVYDSSDDEYGYKVVKRVKDDTGAVVSTTETSTSMYSNYLRIYQYNHGTSSWVELNDSGFDLSGHPEKASFAFTVLTGEVASENFAGTPIESLNGNATDDVGIYKIVNTRTNEEKEFHIVQLTGRVVLYD